LKDTSTIHLHLNIQDSNRLISLIFEKFEILKDWNLLNY